MCKKKIAERSKLRNISCYWDSFVMRHAVLKSCLGYKGNMKLPIVKEQMEKKYNHWKTLPPVKCSPSKRKMSVTVVYSSTLQAPIRLRKNKKKCNRSYGTHLLRHSCCNDFCSLKISRNPLKYFGLALPN